MGIGRKSDKPRAAGMRALRSGGRVSGKDAEAYARDKGPRQSEFAQRKAAAQAAKRRGRS